MSALSGINESLLRLRSVRLVRSGRSRHAFGAGTTDPLLLNEVERIMIRNLSSVSTTFYYYLPAAAALGFLRSTVAGRGGKSIAAMILTAVFISIVV